MMVTGYANEIKKKNLIKTSLLHFSALKKMAYGKQKNCI